MPCEANGLAPGSTTSATIFNRTCRSPIRRIPTIYSLFMLPCLITSNKRGMRSASFSRNTRCSLFIEPTILNIFTVNIDYRTANHNGLKLKKKGTHWMPFFLLNVSRMTKRRRYFQLPVSMSRPESYGASWLRVFL